MLGNINLVKTYRGEVSIAIHATVSTKLDLPPPDSGDGMLTLFTLLVS